MFNGLFKKFEDSRDVDQLIFDIAEHQRDKDHKALYKIVIKTRLFSSILSGSIENIPAGEKYIIKSDDKINISLVEMNGLKLIPFYTSPYHKNLGNNFFEIDGIDALEMTLKSQGVSGLIIQNKENSWIYFDNQKIRWILSKYKL